MNVLHELRDHVQSKYPDVRTEITDPLREDGFWHLDVWRGTEFFCIQWAADVGFGLSGAREDSYGEGPEFAAATLDEAKTRLNALLDGTHPNRLL